MLPNMWVTVANDLILYIYFFDPPGRLDFKHYSFWGFWRGAFTMMS